MSPASYRAAPPRVATPPYTGAGVRSAWVWCHARDGTPLPRNGYRAWLPMPARVPPYSRRVTGGEVPGGEATSAFAGDPQPVEVFHRGIWYTGELLGWRFDDSGRALARIRCVVDGLRHSTWKDLTDLRLPERGTRDPAAAPAPAPVAAAEPV